MNVLILNILVLISIHFHITETKVIHHTIYAGIFFNISTPNLNYNNTTNWLQASNSFTYGLALPTMVGNEILLTGRHGTYYQLSIVSPKLWNQNTLTSNKCNRFYESRIMAIIEVTKRNVSALSVSDRIELLSIIARSACLSDLQHVVLTTTQGILFSTILAFHQNYRRSYNRQSSLQDSYLFVWKPCCQNNSLENTIEKLKILAGNLQTLLGEIDWFLMPLSSFERDNRKQKRSINIPQTYHIITNLNELKIVDTQIMNYVIPNTVFPLYSFPNGINVFLFVNKTRILLKSNQNYWIKFSPSTRNLKFQPTIKDRGIHQLHICSNGSSSNESCAAFQIIVRSSSPQVHQIHIRDGKNDYVINYTLPLVWFRAQKVIKDSQIQITGVRASVPIAWGNHNSLLFLNLSSIEGTVLEFMIDVIVNNDSFVQLELMMPLMSLSKPRTIIYQFQSTITWLKFPFTVSKILVFELKSILEMMATRISELLSNNLRIQIIPLQIYSDNFDSISIQKSNFKFDWTFSINSDLPKSCIIETELIIKSLIKISKENVLFFNTTLFQNKINSGCGPTNKLQQTTSVPIIPRSSPFSLLISSTIKTDIHWKETVIPNLKLYVECGKIFQFSLPSDISGIQNMQIVPVIFTGPKPDWITFSNSNQIISGIIAKSICPKSEFHFLINGTDFRKQITVRMKIIIDISTSSLSDHHKFQVDLVFTNIIRFRLSQTIETILYLTQYIKSACQPNIKCQFNITLLRPPNKNDELLYLSLGILENSTVCPQTFGIFLRNHIMKKSFEQIDSANIRLVKTLYRKGIGELISAKFSLQGICQNKKIFPPDLGKKLVFNNIPSFVSLKPFLEFYNHSVEFYIDNQSTNSMSNENFSNWMKLSNDSSILYILASTEHVRKQPYIVELSINLNRKHKILLPKIAIEVRNLMHHPYFIPYIRELNHQISVDITTNLLLTDSVMPLDITLEVCANIDKILRSDCENILKNDCGTDILVFLNSLVENQEGSSINYKLSSLQILTGWNLSESYESSNFKIKCPIKLLNQIEMKLKNSLTGNRFGSFNNKSWTFDYKVLYMGPCVHTETAYVKINVVEESTPMQKKIQKETKVYFENTQQMFLMATVIPASSFICITLVLGITTACLLNRRNRKKNLFESSTLKIKTDYPPVIFQSDLDAYSPPSKPLILQNEKPPQPLPDDEEEYDGILIPNVQSMKFYRPTV